MYKAIEANITLIILLNYVKIPMANEFYSRQIQAISSLAHTMPMKSFRLDKSFMDINATISMKFKHEEWETKVS